MKTAEDILKSKLNNTQWNYLHHVLHSGEVYKQILEGMEEYAQQQVKLFATPTVEIPNKKQPKKLFLFRVIARLFHIHNWITVQESKKPIGNWMGKTIYQATKGCECGKERIVKIMNI